MENRVGSFIRTPYCSFPPEFNALLILMRRKATFTLLRDSLYALGAIVGEAVVKGRAGVQSGRIRF